MLRVTLEVVPGGDEDDKYTIGTAVIANVSEGPSLDFGDYDVRLETSLGLEIKTRVDGFPRRLGAWALVKECLGRCLGEEV